MPSDQPTVHSERRDRVLVVRIDREAKRNAIDSATASGIDEALNLLEDDDQLWAGVITGTTAVFSAGSDLRDGTGEPTERGGEYGVIRRRRSKPLVAAVEGPAFGGGFEIALACDLVVASTTARFALPESRRGVIASSGALFRAMRALPLNVAKELLITGAVLDAERGYQLGFVNRVTAPGGALAAALEVAGDICASSPVSVAASLAALAAQHDDADAAGWAVTAEAVERVKASDDLREGVSAFFEKRQPRWPATDETQAVERVMASEDVIEPQAPAVLKGAIIVKVTEDRIRVALADDDVLLREGLASLLERSGFDVVGQCAAAPMLLALVREQRPELVIVDIRMPPGHSTEGLEAARQIRAEFPDIAILVLSAHVEVEDAMGLLASGQRSGYLLKSRVINVDDFVDTLKRLVKGASVVDPALVAELVTARQADDVLGVLSPREREVLALMAEGRSNSGIARELWVTEGTVEKHIGSILTKLRLPETDDMHRRVLAVLAFLKAL